MFLQSFSGILPPNSDENQKKISTEFWFYLSPEFRIFCCQVGITCQRTEGARHISPPLVSDPRMRRPQAFPKSTPMAIYRVVYL